MPWRSPCTTRPAPMKAAPATGRPASVARLPPGGLPPPKVARSPPGTIWSRPILRPRRMTMLESLSVGLFTAKQMRATDAAAIDGLGIPGGHLMERAGAAVAREIMLAFDPESVVIYAGKGNNGGDGFVVARELFNAGIDVTVFAIAGRDAYQGDARLNLEIAEKLGVEIVDGVEPVGDADVALDAVFGTGFSGVAKGAAAAAIEAMNTSAAAVVALDIASGVDASTGELRGPSVLADLTVTLHAPKVGHFVSP